MTDSDLKPYPHYKPSGVEWLGDVPAHWDVRRLKWVASLNPSKTEARTFLTADMPVTFLPMERVGTDGEIDEKRASASAVWNGFTYFRRDDVIVAKITPCFENGKGACLDALSTEIGFGSTEFYVLRARSSISPQFLYRLTTLAQFRHSGAEEMTGAAGQKRVPQAFVANYPFPIPPLAEQAAIVRYLDHTDGRIRRYLRSRERLIELLKEYRQATIHEAVTQGLDPDVPLKPSGTEWLGDVPAHWEVRRLKFSVENVADQTHKRRAHEIYLAMEHVESWTGKYSEAGPDVVFDSQVKRFKAGDVLFGKLRPYLAKVTRPNRMGVCVGEFLVLRPRACALSPGYLEYLMRSKPVIDAINASTFGAKMPRADWQFIGGMVQPIPPLAEQAAIAAYLDKQTAAIDAAMARAQREIDLLSEYRTRLIVDVVTGQVDVREATRSLDDAIAEVPSFDESEQA